MSPSSFFHKRRAREALRLAKDPLPASPEACASWSLVTGRALHPGPPQTVQGSETSGWSSPPADRDPGGGGAWRNLGARPQAAAEPPVSADPVLSYGAWGTAPAEPGCREGRWCHSEAPHVCLSLSLSRLVFIKLTPLAGCSRVPRMCGFDGFCGLFLTDI